MRIALLTTDNREHYKNYSSETPAFGTAPQALLDGFARLPDMEVHVLSCFQKMPVSSPNKLAANIWYHGLHVPKVGWLRTGYQGCIRAVRRKLRKIRPNLVHGQGTERDCGISAVLSGYPNVLTIHGNMRLIAAMFPPRMFSAHWLTARLEAWTLPRSNGVVCITNYTRDALKDLARKTWLLPNAVDWSFHAVKSTPAVPPKILCVANVDQRKNQIALIDALAPLADTRNFEIVFLGVAHRHTDYGAEFHRRVEEYPWCTYAGMASRDELREHFRNASLVVLPTREDNCPMVVLEAMAAGIPVVASAVGGVPDLIDDGRTGLLTNPDKPETMRAAVEKLLAEPKFALELAGNAISEAERRFHPRVIADKHLEIYREVLAGR
mgnify:CR=1 FL=1